MNKTYRVKIKLFEGNKVKELMVKAENKTLVRKLLKQKYGTHTFKILKLEVIDDD